jgi:hypothetical protein
VDPPGDGRVIALTIAPPIGDINRFASPTKPCGHGGPTASCIAVFAAGSNL